MKKFIPFLIIIVLLSSLFFAAINIGSINVTVMELLRGLFVEYDPRVAAIYDLRFPRIFVAMLAGAAISASGVLMQAVLKNPLADPGIIGVSSGAGFAVVLVVVFFPTLYRFIPVAALLGALLAFALVYLLACQSGVSPIRLILVGIAMSAVFTGFASFLNAMTGGQLTGVAAIVNGNMTLKTWRDVRELSVYVIGGLILSLCLIRSCNFMALEEKTARGIGINVGVNRLAISLTAVLLAGIAAGFVGTISFLGLIVPHKGRLIVGHDHKYLLPFSMLLGAFTLLLADTVGRVIAHPYEVNATIMMALVGGPAFILLLRRSGKHVRH